MTLCSCVSCVVSLQQIHIAEISGQTGKIVINVSITLGFGAKRSSMRSRHVRVGGTLRDCVPHCNLWAPAPQKVSAQSWREGLFFGKLFTKPSKASGSGRTWQWWDLQSPETHKEVCRRCWSRAYGGPLGLCSRVLSAALANPDCSRISLRSYSFVLLDSLVSIPLGSESTIP